MLASIAALALRQRIAAFGSFEAHMACGIGACMGCVIKVKGQPAYKRVCKDGPVFALNQVVFSGRRK
jgi:dihydroorotate dehydrogenase electron transfer subunit